MINAEHHVFLVIMVIILTANIYIKQLKMRTFFLFILVVYSLEFINAQTVGEKAKAYYFEAQNQYDSGNYNEALNYLQKTEDALGSTNARILSLKVKVLYDAKRYNEAKSAITQFGNFDNNTNEELKRETYSYLIKIEEAEKKQKEKRIAEENRLAEEKRKEEENRILEEKRRNAELKRQAKEKRIDEERRIAEEKKKKMLETEHLALIQKKFKKNKLLAENGLRDNRDGKHYKLVAIGGQLWMAENLAYKTQKGCFGEKKRHGDVSRFGYLYSWEAAKTICPTGWRLPSVTDYETLINNYGKLDKDNSSESKPFLPNGKSGFSALLGGSFLKGLKNFGIGKFTIFWTSSIKEDYYIRQLTVDDNSIRLNTVAQAPIGRNYVRCLLDD